MIQSAVYSELNAFFNAKEKGVSFQEFIKGIHKYELMDAEGDKVCDDDELINFLTDNSIDYEFVSLHKSTYGDVYMIFTYFYIYLLPQCKKGSKYYVDFSKLTRYKSNYESQIVHCPECQEELSYVNATDFIFDNGKWKEETFPTAITSNLKSGSSMKLAFCRLKYGKLPKILSLVTLTDDKLKEKHKKECEKIGIYCPHCGKKINLQENKTY